MEDEVKDFLEKSLDRVNGWLQFAEAKHAALIAFLVAILAIIFSGDFLKNVMMQAVVSGIYIIALICSIVSFYPRYDKDTSQPSGSCEDDDNMLFWKDIAKQSEQTFLKRIYADFCGENKENFSTGEKLYA